MYGAPEEIRTPDTRLRRPLLYPPELQAHTLTLYRSFAYLRIANLERVMGIEPTRPAWKAGILPLNYTRTHNAHTFYQTQRNMSNVFMQLSAIFLKIFYCFSVHFDCTKFILIYSMYAPSPVRAEIFFYEKIFLPEKDFCSDRVHFKFIFRKFIIYSIFLYNSTVSRATFWRRRELYRKNGQPRTIRREENVVKFTEVW